jgi:hypothetical protein
VIRLHQWAFATAAWREQHGARGGALDQAVRWKLPAHRPNTPRPADLAERAALRYAATRWKSTR